MSMCVRVPIHPVSPNPPGWRWLICESLTPYKSLCRSANGYRSFFFLADQKRGKPNKKKPADTTRQGATLLKQASNDNFCLNKKKYIFFMFQQKRLRVTLRLDSRAKFLALKPGIQQQQPYHYKTNDNRNSLYKRPYRTR